MSAFAAKSYDARQYQAERPSYPTALYELILHRISQGGDQPDGSVLDLGCGPGIVTSALAPYFSHAQGVDPSENMIQAARESVTVKTKSGEDIKWTVGGADSIPSVPDASVDLVVAGTAAHYFPEGWWNEMLRILKPGGHVALFTYTFFTLYERGPLGEEIEKYLDLQGLLRALPKYQDPKHNSFASLYDTLAMPRPMDGWGEIYRRKWTGASADDPRYLMIIRSNLKSLQANLSTASPVHNWRQMFPNKANGPDDLVLRRFNNLKAKMNWTDDQSISVFRPLGLVMIQKE